jgi:Zn-finger nucleic acid-binding protein
MALTEGEFKALISLLDDSDREVYEHVTEKLIEMGVSGIPMLENAWEFSENELVQSRLEELIGKIQFENIVDRLQKWIDNGCENLLEAALLVAKFQYPELDEQRFHLKLEKIFHSVWIHLSANMSPLEEVNVINRILFKEFEFKGNKEPQPDADLSYINTVLDNRKGNSIGIGILYLIIAERLDLCIYGVNLPYHFILCATSRLMSTEELLQSDQERAVLFYMNPLLEGVPFSRIEITRYLEQSRITSHKKYYSPCQNSEIIKTLIYNQLSCYDQNGDMEKGRKMKVLFDLFPLHASEEDRFYASEDTDPEL